MFSGRSFAPKDLIGEFDEEDEDFMNQLGSPASQDLRDSVFFDFHHGIHDAIQEEPDLLDEVDFVPGPPERASSPGL